MWSFGVVLYVLLCGSPPFQHRHLRQLYDLIKRAEFAFRGARWGSVSSEAKDLICSCLVPDAAKRLTAEQCLEHPWLLGKKMPTRYVRPFSLLPCLAVCSTVSHLVVCVSEKWRFVSCPRLQYIGFLRRPSPVFNDSANHDHSWWAKRYARDIEKGDVTA